MRALSREAAARATIPRLLTSLSPALIQHG
jgi:hypothetical protein